ncbi:MAG: helix-turn-helix transcriptional regulator [Lachnospiraceae bacterium]|nr:helix-turn-helix transcriptional regulator [Lachnospiraceae bacterium]
MKDRIKELRKFLGLTQQKFADRLRLKRQTVAAYEIGNIEPSESTLLLICKEFNINEEWLRNGTPPMEKPTTDKLSTYVAQICKGDDEFIQDLIEIYMELDPDSKKALRIMADKMYEKRKERGQ